MLELLEMSIRKRTLLEETIAPQKESRSITTRETTDFHQVDLESKLNLQRQINKYYI